jgi:hypothetical protein
MDPGEPEGELWLIGFFEALGWRRVWFLICSVPVPRLYCRPLAEQEKGVLEESWFGKGRNVVYYLMYGHDLCWQHDLVYLDCSISLFRILSECGGICVGGDWTAVVDGSVLILEEDVPY